ncbi:sesquipedalian-1 isoform X1 [Pan paniscus]|uniref:sesquipedalian-1 isoform X1 n=1 Tax=Pan paniscus TaxID=9597 RepID=UPI001560447E|nr:sesquipedalian-1 isoform X1 [Pan paniscus]
MQASCTRRVGGTRPTTGAGSCCAGTCSSTSRTLPAVSPWASSSWRAAPWSWWRPPRSSPSLCASRGPGRAPTCWPLRVRMPWRAGSRPCRVPASTTCGWWCASWSSSWRLYVAGVAWPCPSPSPSPCPCPRPCPLPRPQSRPCLLPQPRSQPCPCPAGPVPSRPRRMAALSGALRPPSGLDPSPLHHRLAAGPQHPTGPWTWPPSPGCTSAMARRSGPCVASGSAAGSSPEATRVPVLGGHKLYALWDRPGPGETGGADPEGNHGQGWPPGPEWPGFGGCRL